MRSTGGLVSIIVVSTLRYFSQKVNCDNVKSWRKSILPGFPWSAWRSWSPWGSWGWRRRASASGCRRTRPPPPPPSRRRHQTPRNPCQTALLVRLLICKVFIVDHIFLFLNLVSTCRHEEVEVVWKNCQHVNNVHRPFDKVTFLRWARKPWETLLNSEYLCITKPEQVLYCKPRYTSSFRLGQSLSIIHKQKRKF